MSELHRSIYKKHYGSIPIDDEGRTFDVHHKDGKRSNNDPDFFIVTEETE